MKFVKRHKKLVISLSIVFVILITLLILTFTVFSLKEAELKLKTEASVLTVDVQKEIENEVLKTGGSVLFLNKEKLSLNLERKFPYLKIVNIETIIPNKLVIHCAEREELFAVNSNGKAYFLDEELKILRISSSTYSKQENGPILLTLKSVLIDNNQKAYSSKIDLNLSGCEAGQTVNFSNSDGSEGFSEKLEQIALSILTSFEENEIQISDVRSKFNEFEIFYEPVEVGEIVSWHTALKLVDNAGFVSEIFDASTLLSEKIEVMFVGLAEASGNPGLIAGKMLFVSQNSNGEFIYKFLAQ